jgi:hypothetical protein
MAVYSMAFIGLAPFGALMAGALAEQVSAPFTVAAGGAVCIACAFWFQLRQRRAGAAADTGGPECDPRP